MKLKLLMIIVAVFFKTFSLSAQQLALDSVTPFGGTSVDRGIAITNSVIDEIITAGVYSNTVNFGGGWSLTAQGAYDTYVLIQNEYLSNLVMYSFGGPGGTCIPFSVQSDNQLNTYVSGKMSGTIDFDPNPTVQNFTSVGLEDHFIVKIGPAGQFGWVKQLSGINIAETGSMTLNYGIVVTGTFSGTVDFDPGPGVYNMTSTSSYNTFILQLNYITGNLDWVYQLEGSSNHGLKISPDPLPGSYMYLIGDFSGTVDFNPDPGSGVYNLTATSPGDDGYIIKLGTSGALVWAAQIENSQNVSMKHLIPDGTGGIIATGSFSGTVDLNPGTGTNNHTSNGNSDAFLLKLNSNGSYAWSKSFGGAGDDEGVYLAKDANGEIYLTGDFMNTVDFNPGSLNSTITSAGLSDVFITKYSASGMYYNVTTYGGASDDFPSAAHLFVNNGDLYITGEFNNQTDFQPGLATYNVTTVGMTDGYVARYQPTSCTPTYGSFSAIACGSYNAPSGSQIWTVSGVYQDTIPNYMGCDSILTINLTINPIPPVQITGNTIICIGASTTICASAGFASYLWSTGETTACINVNNGGAYTVTVQDANGCTGTDTHVIFIVSNPVVNLGPDAAICQGNCITLYASPAQTFQWNTGSTTSSINVCNAGIYWVIITDNNGCTGSDSINIIVNPIPVPVITAADTSLCFGESTTLNAGSGYANYLWSNGSSSQSINVSLTGPYTVTVTDMNGCTGTDNIIIQVNPNPVPVITGDTTLCPGETTILNAGVGYTNYLWITGAMTQTITTSVTNTFTVTVTDANGCTGTDHITVIAAPPYTTTLSASGPLGICQGDSVQLIEPSPMSSYQWYKNNVLIPGAAALSLWAHTTGWYKCLSTDLQNCPAASNQLRVRIVCFPPIDPGERVTGVSNSYSVYPNPSTSDFYISTTGGFSGKEVVNVFDMTGRIIAFEKFENGSGIRLSFPGNGLYVIRISEGSNNWKTIVSRIGTDN